MKRYRGVATLEVLPKEANVFIVAPTELAGASILANGEDIGSLWPEGLVRRNALLGIFARELPASDRAVGLLVLAVGRHEVVVKKSGYEAITLQIVCTEKERTRAEIEPAMLRAPKTG